MHKKQRLFYYILTVIFSIDLFYFAVMFFTHAIKKMGNLPDLPITIKKLLKALYLEEFSMTFWLISIVSMVLIIVIEFVFYRKVIPKINLILPLTFFIVVLTILAVNIFLVPILTYKTSIVYTFIILLCTVFFLIFAFAHRNVTRVNK